MHIKFRKNIIFKISLSILFTLLSLMLILILINQGKKDPTVLSKTLGMDSFADFFITNIGGILTGIILGTAIIIVIRYAFFSKRFKNPDFVLREAIQKIEHGDLSTRIITPAKQEPHPLTNDFNLMCSALDKKFSAIHNIRKELTQIEFNLQQVRIDNSLGPEYLNTQLKSMQSKIFLMEEVLEDMELSATTAASRVLIIGSGGREHTICHMAAKSPLTKKVFAIPGSSGMAQVATCVPLPLKPPFKEVVNFTKEHNIDLVIVGPEQPLVDGICDTLRKQKMKVFGPDKHGAKIEGSKKFAKKLMQKYNVPTAAYAEFNSAKKAIQYIDETAGPFVIKADGLAAGKGVFITSNKEEAKQAINNYMIENIFGKAGKSVIIEEFMQGEEASILALVDKNSIIPLISAQDHKAVYDGDNGPNTGGMGAYAPAPLVTPEILAEVQEKVLEPMLLAFQKEGFDYRGVLYAGLMMTEQGPKVVEFNCRFGDPETQVVLPLLETDFIELALATVDNRLAETTIRYKNKSAVCVVMAAAGYPEDYPKGDIISGLDKEYQDCTIFHSGTTQNNNGEWLTNGGRVLGVSAISDSLQEAINKAYQTVNQINFSGSHSRTDIGAKGLARINK